MKITQATVEVRNTDEAAHFYGAVLGLPTTTDSGRVTVVAGRSRLVFVKNPAVEGHHHVAFTIPSNRFAEAKRWVSERADIMSKGGQDEFEYEAGWNARSLYFAGPEGSVLEFIIRRDLNNASEGEFSADDLECVSEVGVPVPDVLATVDLLSTEAGIEPYGLTPRDRFSPVGTIDGLLILVTPNRPWFPADDLLSAPTRIMLEATDAKPGVYPLGDVSELTVVT